MAEAPDEELCEFILSIRDPRAPGPREPEVTKALDSLYTEHPDTKLMLTHSVAETIFPSWEYLRSGLVETARRYVAAAPHFRHGEWGTYAFRLFQGPEAPASRKAIATDPADGPLIRMVAAMKEQHAKTSGAYKAMYELSLHRTSDIGLPANRPCLMHLSFKLHQKRVHLTALYRSHEYGYKAFGNLLGLARLQWAVAHEVGADMGGLVVHSSRAWISPRLGAARLRAVADLSKS